MIARSLRWRLLAGAAGATFVALAVALLVMSYLFEAHVERNVEQSLRLQGRDLVAALTLNLEGELIVEPLPADPRFALPSSGLYWQVSQGPTLLRSRSLWEGALALEGAHIAADDWSVGDAPGPFEQRLIYVARRVTRAANEPPVLVVIASDHAAVDAARDEFSRDLAIFLALLWLVLSAAAWLQVHLGLRPLNAVRDALDDMRRQPSARLEQDDYPAEAAPLAQAINALADARQRDTERARQRAGDLAHSLKTPLAALAAQSRRAREAGVADAADGLDRAIEAARGAVERELTRARLAAEQGGASTVAGPVIDRLIAVIERTERCARVRFENAAGNALLPISEAALMELLGPLLENAARFAKMQVRIVGGTSFLRVEDDGPGLTDEEASQALERGRRLDEAAPGHGLGLAIASDIAELSGGALTLCRAELGGLCAEVRWS